MAKKNSNPPAPQPEMFSEAAGVRPVAGATHATAAQLAVALRLPDLDDAFLRNHHKDGIPKPVKGKYPINETIIALLKFYHGKLAARDGLPESYDSMQAMENSFLRLPKEFTKWSVKNGAADAQLGGSRIDPRPVLEKAADILRRVASGSVSGIEGFEEWNKDTEIAKKVREDQIKGERENALADRRIFDLLTVEERVRTELLTPLRDGLHGLQKKFQRMKKNRELVATEIMTTDLPKLLEKLAADGKIE